jgi:predicted metal-dependent phosphoesterase TrpH
LLKIDLHLHSSFSDGVLSPERLAGRLKAGGVSVASLTDHDSTEGTGAFLASCREASIEAIGGVELSAASEKVLHILGDRFDTESGGLRDAIEKCGRGRAGRNASICEKLRKLGLDVSPEEAAVHAEGVVGRPHIARVLWNKGYVPNVRAAFDRYLGRGAPAYVPRLLPSAEEWIRLIREAGGLPVLAHPIQTTPDLDDLPPLLSRLKEAGLWGLECWFAGGGRRETYRCLEIAGKFGLYPTAGSDFHGGSHSVTSPGVTVGDDLLPWACLFGP